MKYLTIKTEGRGEFEEKKSLFIGQIKRVINEEDAKAFIQKIKSEQKEARHNVYAYIIGQNMGIQRYNDDGEPQGTGGIPVLETMKKSGITDVVIVVTRYFGGVLLGTGGLARAYGRGASIAIKEGSIVEKVKGSPVKIEIAYDMLGKIQYLCEKNSWPIEEIEYTERVKIKMFIEIDKIREIQNAMVETTSAQCVIEIGKEGLYYKEGEKLFEESTI